MQSSPPTRGFRHADPPGLTRREAAGRWAALSLGACWLALIAAGAALATPGWPGLAAAGLAACTAVAAAATGFAAWSGRQEAARARQRHRSLRVLAEREANGVLVCRGERIVAANAAARSLLAPMGEPGTGAAVEGSVLAGVVPGWTVGRIPETGEAEALVSLGGHEVRLLLARRTAHLGERSYAVVSVRDGGSPARNQAHLWDAMAACFADPPPGAFGLLLLELRRPGGTVEDELMRRVGTQLGAGSGGVRFTARLGRNRFALLVDGNDPVRLRALGDSLRTVLAEWLRADGGAPGVDVRTGAALAFLEASGPGALVDAAERDMLRDLVQDGEACSAG